MNLVFDSSAWQAYFGGGEKSFAVEKLLKENAGKILTTTANLYEIKYLSLREGREKADAAVAFVRNNAQIVPIDEYLAMAAAELRASHGLSAVDAFTLAASQAHGAKIVSADPHFAPFKKHLLKI